VGDLVTGVVPDDDHKAFSCSVCQTWVQGQECSQGSITTIHCSRLIQSGAAPRVSTTCLPDVITHDQIGGLPLCIYMMSSHMTRSAAFLCIYMLQSDQRLEVERPGKLDLSPGF